MRPRSRSICAALVLVLAVTQAAATVCALQCTSMPSTAGGPTATTGASAEGDCHTLENLATVRFAGSSSHGCQDHGGLAGIATPVTPPRTDTVVMLATSTAPSVAHHTSPRQPATAQTVAPPGPPPTPPIRPLSALRI